MVRVEAGRRRGSSRRPPSSPQATSCSRTARGRRGSGTSAAPSPSAPTSWSSPSRSPSSSSGPAGPSHMGVADLREMLYYLRRTADDRIAIGGGAMGIVCDARIRGRVLTSPRLAEAAAHGLTWLFPQLEGVRFDAAWSGPMDITGPALPFFESAPGGSGPRAASASPATASPAPGSAARSSASLVLARRRRVEPHAGRRPAAHAAPAGARCAGRSCSRSAWPTRPATGRTSRDGARACCRAPSSPATAATARSTARPAVTRDRPPRAARAAPGERAFLAPESAVPWEYDPPNEGDTAENRWRTLVSANRTPTSGLSMGVFEVPPGAQLAPHHHAPQEVYYVLAGEAEVFVDGAWRHARPGDVAYPGRRRPRCAQPRRFHLPHRLGLPDGHPRRDRYRDVAGP